MKLALLPALITAMFASAAGATERELLFGPAEAPAKTAKPAVSKEPRPANAIAKERKAPDAVTASAPKAAATPAKPAETAGVKPAVKADVNAVAKAEVKAAPKSVASSAATAPVAKPPAVAAAPVAPTVAAKPVAAAPAVAAAPKASSAAAKAAAPTASVPAAVAQKPKEPVAPVAVKPAQAPTAVTQKPVVQAAPVTATAPQMPDLSSVQAKAVVFGSDPVTERSRLAQTMRQSVSFGTLGLSDTFDFQRSFLPLANLLSHSAGVLVNITPDASAAQMSRKILDNTYPLALVGPSMTRQAMAAGYVPMLVSSDETAVAYIVKSDAKFKDLGELKTAKVALAAQSPLKSLAVADLAAKGVGKDAKFVELSTTEVKLAEAVVEGAADVALVRAAGADKLVADSKGALKVLALGKALPSLGVWVRSDLVSNDKVQRMGKAMMEVHAGASATGKVAAAGLRQGLGYSGKFVAPAPSFVSELAQHWSAAEKASPEALPKVEKNDKVVAANLARPAFESREPSSAKADPVSDRLQLAARLKEGFNTGVLSFDAASQDIYAYQSQVLPLSNHLSQRSGVLVSMIPERDIATFPRRIAEQDYAVIVVGTSFVQAAAKSGYVPVAHSVENTTSALVVKKDSPLQAHKDLAGKTVAAARFADATMLGRFEILKSGTKDVKFTLHDALDNPAAVLAKADAVLLDAETAAAVVAKSGGALRLVKGAEAAPALSVWVREDAAGAAVVKSVVSALIDSGAQNSDVKKKAAAAFARATGVSLEWLASSSADHKAAVEMSDKLIAANQSLVAEAPKAVEAAKKNQAKPLTFLVAKVAK